MEMQLQIILLEDIIHQPHRRQHWMLQVHYRHYHPHRRPCKFFYIILLFLLSIIIYLCWEKMNVEGTRICLFFCACCVSIILVCCFFSKILPRRGIGERWRRPALDHYLFERENIYNDSHVRLFFSHNIIIIQNIRKHKQLINIIINNNKYI